MKGGLNTLGLWNWLKGNDGIPLFDRLPLSAVGALGKASEMFLGVSFSSRNLDGGGISKPLYNVKSNVAFSAGTLPMFFMVFPIN